MRIVCGSINQANGSTRKDAKKKFENTLFAATSPELAAREFALDIVILRTNVIEK